MPTLSEAKVRALPRDLLGKKSAAKDRGICCSSTSEGLQTNKVNSAYSGEFLSSLWNGARWRLARINYCRIAPGPRGSRWCRPTLTIES